jgi:hypothetical protein
LGKFWATPANIFQGGRHPKRRYVIDVNKEYYCSSCEKYKNISFFKCSKKTGLPEKRCLECSLNKRRIYNAENLEQNNQTKLKWAVENPNKVSISRKKWKDNNPGKVEADRVQRKKRIKQATPKCQTETQRIGIEAVYLRAKTSSCVRGPYHVDHIIPLNAKNICGLHVYWNLETRKAEENLKKSNKIPKYIEPTYYDGDINE